jgi:hypothetical protein
LSGPRLFFAEAARRAASFAFGRDPKGDVDCALHAALAPSPEKALIWVSSCKNPLNETDQKLVFSVAYFYIV